MMWRQSDALANLADVALKHHGIHCQTEIENSSCIVSSELSIADAMTTMKRNGSPSASSAHSTSSSTVVTNVSSTTTQLVTTQSSATINNRSSPSAAVPTTSTPTSTYYHYPPPPARHHPHPVFEELMKGGQTWEEMEGAELVQLDESEEYLGEAA